MRSDEPVEDSGNTYIFGFGGGFLGRGFGKEGKERKNERTKVNNLMLHAFEKRIDAIKTLPYIQKPQVQI